MVKRLAWTALCVALFTIVYFLVAWQAPKKRDAWVVSSVKVKLERGHGSGVQIAPGYFLTAAHVAVRGKMTVVAAHGGEAPAELLWLNERYDVALLRVKDLIGVAVSPLNCSASPVGMQVKQVGNPGPFQFVHSWGRISRGAEEIARWKSGIVIDIHDAPGSSGGPVLNMRGEVVGITVGGYQGLEGFSIAVPSSAICDLLVRPLHHG